MQRFKRIGVFLKNTQLDQAVLGYSAQISRTGEHDLVFAHVSNPNDPDSQPTPSQSEFAALVRKHMPSDSDAKIETRVLTGNQIDEILKCSRDEDLDLAILGRKLPSSQIGLGAKIARIVRKSPCSVMIVPELCQPHFNRLMVAIDSSDHSKMAMETAFEIATSSPSKPQIVAVMVRSVASGHDVAGHTFQEAANRQQKLGKQELTEFLSKIPSDGFDVEQMVLISESPALAITHAAMARKMDIVIAGSRGSTSTAAALLGSNSEKLLATCALPTLIVKVKGETLGLLEAIFSMS